MVKKIWTKLPSAELTELIEKDSIPPEVTFAITRVTEILDKYYSSSRNAETDDGGIIYLIVPQDANELKNTYLSLLHQYHVQIDDIEFHDKLSETSSIEWFSDLFLVNSEFALTVIYPLRKETALWNI